MMTNIYAPKDEKMFCPECLSHYLTFKKMIFVGDEITISTIYQDQGQAPFYPKEATACKICGYYLENLNQLIREKDIV